MKSHTEVSPNGTASAAGLSLVRVLASITIVVGALACVRKGEEIVPPDSVWCFFGPGEPLVTSSEPRWTGGVDGASAMYYDAKENVVICGVEKRSRGLFIIPGFRKDELVGFLRTEDEVTGVGVTGGSGVWARCRFLGTLADDPRVARAIERHERR